VATDLNNLRIDRSLKSTPRKSSRGLWWIMGLAVVLMAAGLWFFLKPASALDVQVMRVEPVQLKAGDEVTLNATGYIVAAHKISVAPKVIGRVAWIGVDMGDNVKKGDVLVRLEDEEFLAQVKQQQGQLDAAKAKLQELENGSRPEEIAQAKGVLDQARAEEKNDKATLDRLADLLKTKMIAQQSYDDAEATYLKAAANAQSQQAAYDLMRLGPRKEEIDIQQAQVEQSQGALDLMKLNLDYTVIRAPIDGTILDRNVEVGEFVTTGFVGEGGAKGYVVSLADLNDLRVELDISQNDFNKINPAQKCSVTTDAYPDRKYDGLVDQISPEANRQKATVLVKVKILHPDRLLRPDMNATVAFHRAAASQSPTSEPAEVIVIPTTAMRDGKVFVLEDGKAVERAVKLGQSSPDGVIVTSGLSVGDTLIVNPPPEVKSGVAVRAAGEPTGQ